ncbi:hypothetical protein ACFE04_009724 [Oxalis oulophora]
MSDNWSFSSGYSMIRYFVPKEYDNEIDSEGSADQQQVPQKFFFYISAKLFVDKDGDEFELAKEWTYEHYVECEKLLNEHTNENEVEAMLNLASIPIAEKDVKEILECAFDMAHDTCNMNRHVLQIDLDFEILDGRRRQDDDMDHDDLEASPCSKDAPASSASSRMHV